MAYGARTLNNNWFEERLRPSGIPLHPRTVRHQESALDPQHGDLQGGLLRIPRAPVSVSYALPDDGFNEWQTTAASAFRDPRHYEEFRPPARGNQSLKTSWESAQALSELKAFGNIANDGVDVRREAWLTTTKDFHRHAAERHETSADSLVDQQRQEQARRALNVRARRQVGNLQQGKTDASAKREADGHFVAAESPESEVGTAAVSGEPPNMRSQEWWHAEMHRRSGHLYRPSTSITRSVQAARNKGLTFQDD
eukprot:TRINITY_DN96499_c0_g1_i1.p1 TRINITY_DN96499_c0_g1~~TRINITY_DN96499_c0_g1_i1.p1  ORF type:complete len:267 (-),score=45.64 TRINITY_DN96499_c0_g1_i1:24-785(-)